MNMRVPSAAPATPNGTTRPQVSIVIVGHVYHGKSTQIGRASCRERVFNWV